VEEKKSDSDFFSFWSYGKKIRALRDKKNILTSRVVRKKNSERNKKPLSPLAS